MNDLWEDIKYTTDALLFVLPSLDYSSVDKKEIRNELKTAGENGCFTFLDTYMFTSNRLYQQLALYPEDELSTKRNKIYKYIKKYLSGCLSVNTGGWCG